MELQSVQCLYKAAYNREEGVDKRWLSGWVCNLILCSFPLMIMFSEFAQPHARCYIW